MCPTPPARSCSRRRSWRSGSTTKSPIGWISLRGWSTGVLLFVMLPVVVALALAPLIAADPAVRRDSSPTAGPTPCSSRSSWWRSGGGTGSAPGEAPAWPAGSARCALGLACSIKQTPWFCVPFLVIGVGLEAHRRGRNPWPVAAAVPGHRGRRLLGGQSPVHHLAAERMVDAGRSSRSPNHWWPTARARSPWPARADRWGGAVPCCRSPGSWSIVALLAAFVLWYPGMKRIWLFLLPIVLFVPGRSLSSYLIDLFPAAMIAAVTVAHGPVTVGSPARTGGRRWAAATVVAVPVAGRPGRDGRCLHLRPAAAVGRRVPYLERHPASWTR